MDGKCDMLVHGWMVVSGWAVVSGWVVVSGWRFGSVILDWLWECQITLSNRFCSKN